MLNYIVVYRLLFLWLPVPPTLISTQLQFKTSQVFLDKKDFYTFYKEFPIEMLEECYVTGRDLDGLEGNADDSDDYGETVMS